MKQQLRYLALYCLFIVLGCFSIAASASIVNQASVSYADPKSGSASVSKSSNQVNAILQETISYYTSASYDAEARVGASGKRLYVQASAPNCNIDPTAIDHIVIKMSSTRLASSRNYTATETAPDSGIFRIDSNVITTDSENAKSALAAAAAIALLNMDWNRAKPWLNARASEALGRPFAIAGDLSLTWHRAV